MRKGLPFTPEELREAMNLWANGEAVKVIAAKLRRPQGTVARFMWSDPANFPPRKARDPKKAAKPRLAFRIPEQKIRTITVLGVKLAAMSWDQDAA